MRRSELARRIAQIHAAAFIFEGVRHLWRVEILKAATLGTLGPIWIFIYKRVLAQNAASTAARLDRVVYHQMLVVPQHFLCNHRYIDIIISLFTQLCLGSYVLYA